MTPGFLSFALSLSLYTHTHTHTHNHTQPHGRWLLDQGASPEKILFAGDSAGGGLTIGVMAAARAAGLPLPRGGISFFFVIIFERSHAAGLRLPRGDVCVCVFV